MIDNENLPEIPKNWVWTRLGEIVDSLKGKKPEKLGPKNDALNIPYIVIRSFEHKIFEKYTDGNGCELCDKEDILIVWDGARCGLAGRGVSGAVGSTIVKLICYELDKSFIFYLIQSKYDNINKRPRGVGIPHVDPNVFWNIPVPLPPLSEQQRIVAKIEELFTNLNAGIKALEKVKTQLKRYRQAILKYAFEGKLTREWRELHKEELEPTSVLLEHILKNRRERWEKAELGKMQRNSRFPKDDKWKNAYKEPMRLIHRPDIKLPRRWDWTSLDTLTYFIVDYRGKTPPSSEKGIPVISAANVKNGKIVLDKPRFVSQETYDSWTTRGLPKPGDLIVTTEAPVGEAALYPQDRTYLLTRRVLACQTLGVENFYLMCFFYSDLARDYLNEKSRGTTVPRILKPILFSMPIPLPPLLEQQKIVEEIEQRFSVIDEIEKTVEINLKKTERLRQSILKKAFEGKIVPQNPNDEPAHLLLEKIKTEKTKKNQRKSKKKREKYRQKRLIDYGT
ncbi:MAG: restriction endonuclease subunit S [Theionarchaea archaeon]|nr:restriction endonuclease subunit S [Theionarchaea archaeon]